MAYALVIQCDSRDCTRTVQGAFVAYSPDIYATGEMHALAEGWSLTFARGWRCPDCTARYNFRQAEKRARQRARRANVRT